MTRAKEITELILSEGKVKDAYHKLMRDHHHTKAMRKSKAQDKELSRHADKMKRLQSKVNKHAKKSDKHDKKAGGDGWDVE